MVAGGSGGFSVSRSACVYHSVVFGQAAGERELGGELVMIY